MSDVRSFLDAVGVFFDHLGDVKLSALGIALGLHTLNLLLRTFAWYQILLAAYPGVRYRWSSCAGAYLSGVGFNAIAPARGGDLVKIYLVRSRLEGSTLPTVLATLIVETLFDGLVGLCLMAYAISLGVFPSVPDLPRLPAFEWSWAVEHPRVAAAALAALIVAAIVAGRRAVHSVRAFRERVRQGFTILRTPRRFFVRVIVPQALGWCLRFAAMIFFLRAFGVDGTLRNALLVLVVGSLSTLLPFTPGGVGTQQALIVVVLAGAASSTALLSFSVGVQVAVTVSNALVGAVALGLMFRSFSLRKAIAHARASHHDVADEPSA